MKIVTLGTAGYHPNERRQTTCVVVPEAGLVFDAGTAMFRLPQYLQTPSIDIFLSHAHLDHVVGLTYLLDILYQRPLDQVRVHAEAAKLAALRDHLFSSELFPLDPPYVECPLDGAANVGSQGRVKYQQVAHPGGSVAYRVDWPDRSLAFVTDTTARRDADYSEFIHGVDLLIHECNFPDGKENFAEATGHSTLTPVVELAQASEVGGLVLLHFNPLHAGLPAEDIERAESIFAPIVVAEDGMEIDF